MLTAAAAATTASSAAYVMSVCLWPAMPATTTDTEELPRLSHIHTAGSANSDTLSKKGKLKPQPKVSLAPVMYSHHE